MVKIAPSLLSADFTNLEKEIKKVRNVGADILHLDIMDGHFVPNLTFGLPIIKQIKTISKIPVDVHLMVTNPEKYLETLGDLMNVNHGLLCGLGISDESLEWLINAARKAGVLGAKLTGAGGG